MSYIPKNYEDLGGNRTNVGGELDILAGGIITAAGTQASAITDPTDLASCIVAITALSAAIKGVGITK